MKPTIHYKTLNIANQWVEVHTYGGKLAQNATQSTARDVIRDGSIRIEDHGYSPVLSVHDELVSEDDQGFGSLDEYVRLLSKNSEWNEGLPIAASGWEGFMYRK